MLNWWVRCRQQPGHKTVVVCCSCRSGCIGSGLFARCGHLVGHYLDSNKIGVLRNPTFNGRFPRWNYFSFFSNHHGFQYDFFCSDHGGLNHQICQGGAWTASTAHLGWGRCLGGLRCQVFGDLDGFGWVGLILNRFWMDEKNGSPWEFLVLVEIGYRAKSSNVSHFV